jgi:hypothetical protein
LRTGITNIILSQTPEKTEKAITEITTELSDITIVERNLGLGSEVSSKEIIHSEPISSDDEVEFISPKPQKIPQPSLFGQVFSLIVSWSTATTRQYKQDRNFPTQLETEDKESRKRKEVLLEALLKQ